MCSAPKPAAQQQPATSKDMTPAEKPRVLNQSRATTENSFLRQRVSGVKAKQFLQSVTGNAGNLGKSTLGE